MVVDLVFFFFFFNDTATTEIYTLSLHDALPISHPSDELNPNSDWSTTTMIGTDTISRVIGQDVYDESGEKIGSASDRKSTRLNSSHANISYAVFCLKKKKKQNLTSLTCVINSHR